MIVSKPIRVLLISIIGLTCAMIFSVMYHSTYTIEESFARNKPVNMAIHFLKTTDSLGKTVDREIFPSVHMPARQPWGQTPERVYKVTTEMARRINEQIAGQSVKKILLWNDRGYAESAASKTTKLNFSGCPVNNCELAINQSQASLADAVFIQGEPPERGHQLLSHRRLKQRFIFAQSEPPGHLAKFFKRNDYDNFFNWTMSYRLDADIFVPYNDRVRFGNQAANIRKSFATAPDPRDFSLGKTKLVAWFVSNCRTQSKREMIAHALKKFISVDIYSRKEKNCGPLRCGSGPADNCYHLLSDHYKFYLSLENSLCRDYVTEKLLQVLQHRVVPIVYGAVDYTRYLPRSAYIDVRDFANVRHLADYLKTLDLNNTLYNSYFLWKQNFTGTALTDVGHWACNLCAKLNDKNETPTTHQHFGAWLDQCYGPEAFLKKFLYVTET